MILQTSLTGISLRLADFNRDREIAFMLREKGYRAEGWTLLRLSQDNRHDATFKISSEHAAGSGLSGGFLIIDALEPAYTELPFTEEVEN